MIARAVGPYAEPRTGVIARLRACWHGWLYGSNKDPDWPIRCTTTGCEAPAYTAHARHDGSVVFKCGDCIEHIAAFLPLNEFDWKDQQL